MESRIIPIAILAVLFWGRLSAQDSAPRDASPHSVQFVTVEKDVKLEVLDWGGPGRPLVLLTGLGNHAHVFDQFAPKLAERWHVFGITRRGFGQSSVPATGYAADRLADDVLAVVEALKLNRPVLVGHSLAGEEMSSIGSRHPEKVAGLIYLDAGYSYAYYDRARGDLNLDSLDVQSKLARLTKGGLGSKETALIEEVLALVPTLEKGLRQRLKNLEETPPPPAAAGRPAPPPQYQAIAAGLQKFTDVRGPILAIYALPHDFGQQYPDPKARAAAAARDLEATGAQAKAFETGMPSARVVRLPNANHYVFQSNEADVLREMNTFIASLP